MNGKEKEEEIIKENWKKMDKEKWIKEWIESDGLEYIQDELK